MYETEWLEVGKDVEEILKIYKNELRHQLYCYILILRKYPHKTLFQHTVPPPHVPTELNNIFMLLAGFFSIRDCKMRYRRLNEVDCMILQNSTEK